MFERYTSAARRVLLFARHEASQAGAASIGPEHLLLSLLRISPSLFGRMSQDEASIRNELTGSPGAPEAYGTDPPLSSLAKHAMAYAAEEAEMLGHPHIGTEHLLMGLMHDPDSPVTQLLRRYGIGRAQMRLELASGKPLEPDVPPSREMLHTIVDELPENSLAPALAMLENFKFFPRVAAVPPSVVGGGTFKSVMSAGTRFDIHGNLRDGHFSTSRIEDGARILETRHVYRGIEITFSQRMQLSDDGKTLSYSEEIRGPKQQGYQSTFQFDVSK